MMHFPDTGSTNERTSTMSAERFTEFACPECEGAAFYLARDPEPDVIDRFVGSGGDRLVVLCATCEEVCIDSRDVLSGLRAAARGSRA